MQTRQNTTVHSNTMLTCTCTLMYMDEPPIIITELHSKEEHSHHCYTNCDTCVYTCMFSLLLVEGGKPSTSYRLWYCVCHTHQSNMDTVYTWFLEVSNEIHIYSHAKTAGIVTKYQSKGGHYLLSCSHPYQLTTVICTSEVVSQVNFSLVRKRLGSAIP